MLALFIGGLLLSATSLSGGTSTLLLGTWLLMMCLSLKMALSFNHSLIMLLSLEAFSLVGFLSLMLAPFPGMVSAPLIFSFMTLIVCEASAGLCILVNLGRNKGEDFLPF